MAKDARLGVVINGRGGDVHEQYGEGHCVRVAAPGSDDEDQHADGGAEDELALGGGAGGYGCLLYTSPSPRD